MAGKGAPKGNNYAAKEGRNRIDLHMSLSGKRLQFFEKYVKTESGQDPTNEEIIKTARKMLYWMIDNLNPEGE